LILRGRLPERNRPHLAGLGEQLFFIFEVSRRVVDQSSKKLGQRLLTVLGLHGAAAAGRGARNIRATANKPKTAKTVSPEPTLNSPDPARMATGMMARRAAIRILIENAKMASRET
jgi:hypothetical protein